LDDGHRPGPEFDPDTEPELPADPFPDWYLFTAGHSFPGWRPLTAIEAADGSWAAPLDDPVPENSLLQRA
jgi:hypothetical protein